NPTAWGRPARQQPPVALVAPRHRSDQSYWWVEADSKRPGAAGAGKGRTVTGIPLRTAVPDTGSNRPSSARTLLFTPAWRPATPSRTPAGRGPSRGGLGPAPAPQALDHHLEPAARLAQRADPQRRARDLGRHQSARVTPVASGTGACAPVRR